MMYTTPEEYSDRDLKLMKLVCSESTLHAARLFFLLRDSNRFIVAPHHQIIAKTMDRVARGELKRLIINIPPGYTKTELSVLFFVLKSYIQNPSCRFIHASYSATLATRNSATIRKMTSDPMFQALCPEFVPRADQWTKEWWGNTAGGEFLAVSADGQVTGFRAGHMDKSKFTGAIIFDDPIKPAEALSKVMREKINFNFNNTFRSRLAHDDVPIIIIMQRVHDDDLSGFLLRGGGDGTGEKWHHLIIPARVPDLKEPYPEKYTHGIPIPYDLPPGPIWPYKHSEAELETLKKGNSFVWAGQYMQDPADPASQIFKRAWWPRWDFGAGVDRFNSCFWHGGQKIGIESLHVYADTAMKTGQTNDFSVFQLWCVGSNQKIYLFDQVRGKWEAPELEKQFIAFLNRWRFIPHESNIAIQSVNIEDKASGTGLIQSLNNAISRGAIQCPPITPIPRHVDKVARVLTAAPYVERGDVVIPDSAPWIEDYLSEFEQFTANMTHRHDDQIDPTLDAIHNHLISGAVVDYTSVVRGD
jgi:predicted phage terminase large subunit-like protein